MKASELSVSEYPEFYRPYIEVLGDLELSSALEDSKSSFLELLQSINPEQLQYAYAEGKWTVAEAIIHIIDTERVFQYRVLRLARNDKTELPGFDQNIFVPTCNAQNRSLESIIVEYKAVRESTLTLFYSLDAQALERSSIVSGGNVSARAILYMIAGHQLHHVTILKDRYGI
ncbi:DinB family protein [Flavobacterium sp. ASW18X]|uniref:DinB family protein n=1 Tax=Flavobacterium sp. ASW18X TaxID=2572595 RepID=UPI0010AE5799|nr:DinB family protein [Flavobacterium sp. ASW18X]TKD66136.1 DinB family protein [Flavobacterium sp. ASW18X]